MLLGMANFIDRALSFLQRAYERGSEGASRAIASFGERLDRHSLQVRSQRGWSMTKGSGRINRPGTGERIFGSSSMGAGMNGYPGNWSDDRLTMVRMARGWAYKAIDCIMKRVACLTPNVAYVHTDGPTHGHGIQHRAFHYPGFGMERADALRTRAISSASERFFRDYRYRKSLHQIRPHEEIQPVGANHPLMELLDHPNNTDTAYGLWSELILFLKLTGNAYLWAVPSQLGQAVGSSAPCELWVIPSHWVFAKIGNGRVPEYYQIRPFWGGAAKPLNLPAEEVIWLSYKNPIHKFDGYSPLTAGAEWLDVAQSIDRSRFWSFKNGCFPLGAITMGEGFVDPDGSEIERIGARFINRYQGEMNTGRPLILPPGSEYNPLTIAPTEMAYPESADQMRDWILALFGVPKEVAGIQDQGSEIAMDGPRAQFVENCIAPDLRYLSQALTQHLARRWDDRLRIWWDDPTPDNPEDTRANVSLLAQYGGITPNEMRTIILQLEPFTLGGNNPFLSNKEIPLNEPVNQEVAAALGGAPPGGMPGGLPGLPAPGGEEAMAGLPGEPQPEQPEEQPGELSPQEVQAAGKSFMAELLDGWPDGDSEDDDGEDDFAGGGELAGVNGHTERNGRV